MSAFPEPPLPPPPAPIVVAMSGGVDSSVAALLLRDAGHPVVGVTLQLRDCAEAEATRSCCGSDGVARARAAAATLGIPHYVVDAVRDFAAEVLRPAWDEYALGRTPSPCLPCNERIKFGLLADFGAKIGIPLLATGHYARLGLDPQGRPTLLRGVDSDKDQSYFLAGLSLAQLAHLRFPLGDLRKPEVRQRARQAGLGNADAAESQDACLVARGQSFSAMLCARFGGEPRHGPVVDEAGNVLGEHPGIHHFTVGQRKGLPIRSTQRHWVKAIHAASATVVVTADEAALLQSRFTVHDLNWLAGPLSDRPLRCATQVRYRHRAVPALIERIDATGARVTLEVPVAAVTPGQAAVFYDGARVLGRGWIDSPPDP